MPEQKKCETQGNAKVRLLLEEAIKIEKKKGYTQMPYYDAVNDCIDRDLYSVLAMEYGNKSGTISGKSVYKLAVDLSRICQIKLSKHVQIPDYAQC